MKKTKAKIPKVINDNPENQAIFSKLTKGQNTRANIGNSLGDLKQVNASIIERIRNNEDITQLFPDVELSIQILTSSILAPNDMLTPTIKFVKPDLNIGTEVNDLLATEISTFLDKEYELVEKLPTMVREALFTKGSYIEAILPEASVDEIINSDLYVSSENMEEYINGVEGIGLLDKEVSTESIDLKEYINDNTIKGEVSVDLSLEDLDITVTDDYKLLVTPIAYAKDIDNKIDNKLNLGIESLDISNEDQTLLDNLFRTPNYQDEPYIEVKTTDETMRKSIGKPLIMKLPTEAVIPVHSVNDATNHLGYFILLDENGSPVKTDFKHMDDDQVNNLIAKKDTKLNIINKAKKALQGITKRDPVVKDMKNIYNVIIENSLKKKLMKGSYNGVATISDAEDVYETMFLRGLEGKRTRLLYIPKQMLEYFAFDYRENGTGRSMLEKVSMLFSIRSILLFTRLMANIKNSVTTTEITAKLDDDDMHPEVTMEQIISETMKTRQTQLPIGVTKIDDLVDWSHKVGFKYNFKHPRLPDIDIDVNDTNTSKVVPDDELDDMIQEHIIMSFGLTTELVRSGYDPDFATTVVAKNILLAKRVIVLQNKFTKHLSSYIRKLIINDPRLYEKIESIFENNLPAIKKRLKNVEGINKIKSDSVLVDYLTRTYVHDVKVSLPKPEVTESTNMKDLFDEYVSSLDDYLDIILSSEALPDELLGDMSDKVDNIKTIMKTILVKKWMTDNGYMPEISQFLTRDEDGKPVFNLLEEYAEYSKTLADVILPFLKSNSKFVDKLDEKIEKIENDEDDEPEDTGDTDEGNTDEPEEDNGDEGGDNLDEDTGGAEGDTGDDLGDDAGDVEEPTDGGEEEPIV